MNENEAYWTDDCCMHRNTKEGPQKLTNFMARIKKELVYHDGSKTSTHLVIDGRLHDPEENDKGERKYPDGRPLPETIIPATEFAGLNWVSDRWGMQPIVFPVPSAERELRTAIQIGSKPEREHIYTHTGWTNLKGVPTYLTKSGGITQKGLDKSITVELPHELRNYSLPDPANSREAFIDSLRLVNLGPPETMWPLILATYRAAIGPSDFAIHLAGRTGTFKSEICSLMQSHYGEQMHAKALPASWNSTGNAIEALAYRAKDALFVLDDFVPVGTAYQVRNLQKIADQVIRGQGNQAGRSRLTDVSAMQNTYYPRGMILSTGEDVPEGHSIRARMLILELTPGAVDKAKLSQAQAKRSEYPLAMADWIQWLASTNAADMIKEYRSVIRDKYVEIGHSRTPGIIGDLLATLQLLITYADDKKWLTMQQLGEINEKATKSVLQAAESQTDFLEASDPVKAAMDTLRLLLQTHLAHAKLSNGGIPRDADKLGWTVEQVPGGTPAYKAHGPRIGWIDGKENLFLLDPNALILMKKHSGGKLAVTKETLLKRMKEAGVIVRVDDGRGRNVIRTVIEGHRRSVIALNLKDVLDESEES